LPETFNAADNHQFGQEILHDALVLACRLAASPDGLELVKSKELTRYCEASLSSQHICLFSKIMCQITNLGFLIILLVGTVGLYLLSINSGFSQLELIQESA
jgi:hypothetical protein